MTEDPQRNWDCAVNYWHSATPPDFLAEIYCTGGGNKFEGFLQFWKDDPRARAYRYYLLLDDDLIFEPGDISRFFRLCDKHGTQLCQPSLKWATHYNFKVTMCNPACELRRVSFVEVMAACFSPAAIEELLPTFSLSLSTWGIDWAWACLLQGRVPMHVMDAVAIEHTKPVDVTSGALYRMLKARGVDFQTELNAARSRYGGFGAKRTMFGGHVYRTGMPRAVGMVLVHAIEAFKRIARLKKKAAQFRRKYMPGRAAEHN